MLRGATRPPLGCLLFRERIRGVLQLWLLSIRIVCGLSQRIANIRRAGLSFGAGFGISSRRYCTVNVVMSGGWVSRVNYSGPTGGLLSAGEQCACAVQNCVH
jgi:hypothetical protein